MSLKLIREAQALSRLGANADLAKSVQTILGESSITAVAHMFTEAFDESQYQITPDDYQQWMDALQAEAAERSIDLTKKMNFEDLAHFMFENDPRVDELGLDDSTRQKIVTALWQSFKASRTHASVQRGVGRAINRAREEEEMAAAKEGGNGGFEQDFAIVHGQEEEEKEIKPKKVAGSGSVNPTWVPSKFKKPSFGREDEQKSKSPSRWEHALVGKASGSKNPYAPGTLRHGLWNDVHGAHEDEEVNVGERPRLDFDDLASTERMDDIPGEEGVPGDSDIESRVDDLEARVADIEAGEADEPWHDKDADLGDDSDLEVEFSGSAERKPGRVEVEDEETVKKNMFRNAITAPRSELSQALKDVEEEGRAAWAGMQLPKNPHPKKSQAYNAWQKGFRNHGKDALGIVDKPAAPVKKRK